MRQSKNCFKLFTSVAAVNLQQYLSFRFAAKVSFHSLQSLIKQVGGHANFPTAVMVRAQLLAELYNRCIRLIVGTDNHIRRFWTFLHDKKTRRWF